MAKGFGYTEGLVSIVIPLYGRADLTAKCLDSIYANTEKPYELVLVNNGSTDSTVALQRLQPEGTDLLWVSVSENVGFGRASNAGAAVASGEFLVMLNNDTEVRAGWLEALLAECSEEVGAVAGRLENPDGTLQHAGVTLFYDSNGTLTAENIHEEREAGNADCLAGTALLVRAEAFRDVGGFDPCFYNGYEDVDLSLALSQAGWGLRYTPDSVVMHHLHQSGPSRWTHVQDNIRRLNDQWADLYG